MPSLVQKSTSLSCMQKIRYEPRGVRRPRREENPMGACVPRRQAMGAIWRGPFGWVLNLPRERRYERRLSSPVPHDSSLVARARSSSSLFPKASVRSSTGSPASSSLFCPSLSLTNSHTLHSEHNARLVPRRFLGSLFRTALPRFCQRP